MYVYFDMSVQFHTVSVSSSLIIDPTSYTIDPAPCTMYHVPCAMDVRIVYADRMCVLTIRLIVYPFYGTTAWIVDVGESLIPS